ncbi:MAG: aminopeptidase, partial [Candidatus Saliniplasma sp.]
MSLEKGIKTAVITCMGLKEGEKVVIASDGPTMNIGKKIREVAREITPHVRFFNLDIYGERPLDHFPEAIKEAAEESDVGFWTANSYEGELESIRGPFIKKVLIGGRHGHMVNINKKVIESALAVDYEAIKEFTDKLYDKLIKTDKVRITNEQGTDITASFSDRWKWVPSAGICHEPGHWNNIPDGEVFTAPLKMNGKIVVDGVIGEYFGNKYSHEDLKETPITIKIRTNDRAKAIDVSCDNDELKKEVHGYIHQHDCSPFIGELGFGT